MKILLIEDDPAISSALRRGLRTLYVIDRAETGGDGLHLAEVGGYNAIVLDLSLPDIDGLVVCQRLRLSQNATPILVLTGKSEIKDKITLLDAGVDDYMTKPFSLEELKARLRVLTRRESATVISSVVRVGDLELNVATREIWRAGVAISLRRKEFDLLEYMMRNTGKVLTRSMIVDNVWEMSDNLWTNAVDVHIKYLRDKIDRPFGAPIIKTVHGLGYKLEVPNSVAVSK